MIWKRLKKFLPIIGVGIFIYILLKLDLAKVGEELKNINFLFLVIIIPLVVLSLFIQTLKWFLIARKQKINIPFREAVKINLMSNFYGFITPSRIGTITRANYLKRYTNNVGKGTSNFVLDKVLDLSSLFFITIIFGFVFRDKFGDMLLIWSTILLGVIFLFTIIFMKKERTRALLKVIYIKFIPKTLKEKVRLTFESFYEDIPKKRFLLGIFAVNLFNWLLLYITTYFMGLSIGIDLPIIYFLALLPIGTIVAQIPISINGLGTREVTLISLFGFFGVAATKVFSMSLLSLFFSTIIPSVIAIILIQLDAKSLKRLQAEK